MQQLPALLSLVQANGPSKLAQEAASGAGTAAAEDYVTFEYVQQLFAEMMDAAKLLDFERAQKLRDQIVKLETELKAKHGDAA